MGLSVIALFLSFPLSLPLSAIWLYMDNYIFLELDTSFHKIVEGYKS